ncbi:NADH:quinone oxidoreductase I, membrane subunit N [Campylobacter sputorum subsp. sputorum]|nr:NADH-quinone oxidoreductase subunit NuoN [Campylobacter sputorum]QEL06050.1 NADH:quinone oxidoreductase I, membrane subunit N [Campylobacter sputorum subsp. sputorum]
METINMSLESINIASIAVPGIMVIFAITLLSLNIFVKNLSKTFYALVCIFAIILDLGILFSYKNGISGFFGMINMDGIAFLSQMIILVSSAFFMGFLLCKESFFEYEIKEYFVLFLFVIAGFSFMVSSNNLILILIGLEISSLAIYTLIALKNKIYAIEASIKYFSLGALSSGFYAIGAALLYLLTGHLEIDKILSFIVDANLKESILLLGASAFLLASLAFKLSLIPFHTWIVDVYEGSSSPLAGYMSIVPKIAAFIIMIRFFAPLSDVLWIKNIIFIIAIISMSLGNIMALVQKDVKRMLAYSSISHSGFVICAIAIGTTEANVGLFVYWTMFLFANLGAFGMLFVTSSNGYSWDTRFEHPYSKFAGLIKTMPFFAVIMAIFMFCLAGIPPFSVFWGKMYLISAAVHSDHFCLAVIMAINSAIAIYYYLKLVVIMFMHEPLAVDKSVYVKNLSNPFKFTLGIALLFSVFAIIFIEPLSKFINLLVSSSGF